jgi:hypothetical protein
MILPAGIIKAPASHPRSAVTPAAEVKTPPVLVNFLPVCRLEGPTDEDTAAEALEGER